MLAAVNEMLLDMLDMLAAVARKDYIDRRRRQAEGHAKTKAAGRYRGRTEDRKRNDGIAAMLRADSSWQQVQDAFRCSSSTVARVKRRLDAEQSAGANRCQSARSSVISNPIDWPQLSAEIRFRRAGGRCEHCGRPHGQVVMKWEIDEAIYDEFLKMLPPMGWHGDTFFMREFTFGDITSKFTREGDRYFCEVARHPERPAARPTVASPAPAPKS